MIGGCGGGGGGGGGVAAPAIGAGGTGGSGGGSGGMGGCLVGILILNVFDNGLAIMGVPTYWQTVASGLLLLVALVYDYFASKRSK